MKNESSYFSSFHIVNFCQSVCCLKILAIKVFNFSIDVLDESKEGTDLVLILTPNMSFI